MMIAVVAGILKENDRYMICKRRPGGPEGGKWEFPGGKLEPNEQPEEALQRELWEELRIRVAVGNILFARRCCGEKDLLLLFYEVFLTEGEPVALECEKIAFVPAEELLDYDLARTDALIAKRLCE